MGVESRQLKTTAGRNTINVNNLPDEAKKELGYFYNYLLFKYKGKKQERKKDILASVEKLSWRMGSKLYRHRDELYER